MDRKERLQATLNGENHSGIISGFWYHFSQDAMYGEKAVQAHIDFYNAVNPDVLKVMNEHMFQIREKIEKPEDWRKVTHIPFSEGPYPGLIEEFKAIRKALPADLPLFATVHGVLVSAYHATETPGNFKNPENMITGKIGVPLFTVRNEKIILRHIFAVALSDFFAKQVDVYNSNNADVLLSGDGWERFCAYLSSKPEHLKDVLKASIPESMHRVMGINDFSWTEKLVGKDGVLKVAVDEFRGTVQYYIDEYRRLLAEGLTQQAAAVEKKLWSYRRGKEDNRGRNELIEFLVRNNVLPKYGFPVDTVELYQNMNAATDKKLQMVRDLQLAISEYAPDSQVVADGRLYTSRYIRKLPQTTGQDWETAYIAQCNNPSCMTWNHRLMEPDEGGEPCVSCHVIISKSRWKQAIEPRKPGNRTLPAGIADNNLY